MAPWMLQQVRIIDFLLSSTNRCITFSLGYKYPPFETKQAHVSVSSSPDYVEMWIVMVSMVSGCLMYTVLVANATAMIANTDPAAKEYKSKVLMGDTIICSFYSKWLTSVVQRSQSRSKVLWEEILVSWEEWQTGRCCWVDKSADNCLSFEPVQRYEQWSDVSLLAWQNDTRSCTLEHLERFGSSVSMALQ